MFVTAWFSTIFPQAWNWLLWALLFTPRPGGMPGGIA